MRIDNNAFDKTAANGASSKTSSYSATPSGRNESFETGNSQDAVVMSDLVSLLSGSAGLHDAGRASRIHQLSQQYRAGSYVVDTAALGEALLANAFED